MVSLPSQSKSGYWSEISIGTLMALVILSFGFSGNTFISAIVFVIVDTSFFFIVGGRDYIGTSSSWDRNHNLVWFS